MATTLEAIQAKMKKLQVQADALIAKKAEAAVDQIRKIMLAHGLSTKDIQAEAKAKCATKAANVSASNVKAKATSSLKGGNPAEVSASQNGGHVDGTRPRAGVDCRC
jgi:hypothetical protein